MIGNDLRVRRTSMMLIQMRYIELEGWKTTWVRKSNWETLRLIGSAKAMGIVSRWTEQGAGWMAQ